MRASHFDIGGHMPRVELTDKFLQTVKPAPKGTRIDWMDAVVLKFGVRVTDKADDKGRAASRTFILVDRFPGEKNQIRKTIGSYPAMSLKEGRDTARKWLGQIQEDVHPIKAVAEKQKRQQDEKTRAEQEEKAKVARRFDVVIEDYLEHIKGQRKAADVTREIRNELIEPWKDKLITEITEEDVAALVRAIAGRPAPYQAHNVYGHVRTFYNWAIGAGMKKHGLTHSPCDRLKPAKLIGPKKSRKRVLSDEELFAYWRAATRMGYPFGDCCKLFALLGPRRSEIGEAMRAELHPQIRKLLNNRTARQDINWRAVNDDWKVLTVSEERAKGEEQSLIPLSDAALAVIEGMPIWSGPYLFSTMDGERPISGFSKAKARLDRRMLLTLKALAKLRGEGHRYVKLKPFVFHDLRRTMRTRLSALRVDGDIAELCIGHGKKGMKRVYDQHEFIDEMREALNKWAQRLHELVTPAPHNVISMAQRATR